MGDEHTGRQHRTVRAKDALDDRGAPDACQPLRRSEAPARSAGEDHPDLLCNQRPHRTQRLFQGRLKVLTALATINHWSSERDLRALERRKTVETACELDLQGRQ
jgi:hypothetical protein